ncbi:MULTISPECIES: hypothetical protein [Paenarthrobacter]|uniref:Uncharacterized protein n=1 Tax=Paenarthrobacter ureafaciens TaxID=37931 RepID=A0AAX3EFH1_PAEUR|nr:MULTISPECIES: hypothetical protein [Paenarthrobacter]MDO5866005.1 hypothetical protein [Paenarthrobacter sp. SD-2]MDO5877100.1 hypothetical protein [Paenarthrobacter sp. SD-1]UYV92302.1 hypothetical protein NL395_17535 [Paenarthrobacter ureafaciens]UYV96837.1 hypothetical protein NL394_17565 [Paenarthrobacter ureafaciens]
MSERDELAEDIRGLGITVIDGPPVDLTEPLAQHLHNLGYRKPRTITTTEEVAELPVGTVVLMANGRVWQRNEPSVSGLFQIHAWTCPDGGFVREGNVPRFPFPATVLHEGSAS